MNESLTKSIISAFCFLLFLPTFAQISNVQFEYSCPCSVTVTYDLSAPADVVLYYSPDTVGYSSYGVTAHWLPADTFSRAAGTNIVDIWNCDSAGVHYGLFYFKLQPIPCVCVFDGSLFSCSFNLGADSAYRTPICQMTYLATHGADRYDATIFGDLYQWGRKADGHEKRNSQNVHRTLFGGATYNPDPPLGDGQVNNPEHKGYFVSTNNISPSDWRDPSSGDLWGNGVAISTPTPNGGVLYNGFYYQNPVKGPGDPCPAGYRVPTQDEWERLCDYDNNPTAIPGYVVNIPTTGIANTSTGFTWVATRCGAAVGNTCIVNHTSWDETSPGGYAIYNTSDWNAGYDGSVNYDLLAAGAPQPVLFLPAAGNRYHLNGSLLNGGTPYSGREGHYWSSSISSVGTSYAHCLTFTVSNIVYLSSTSISRARGASVRCVAEN